MLYTESTPIELFPKYQPLYSAIFYLTLGWCRAMINKILLKGEAGSMLYLNHQNNYNSISRSLAPQALLS